jgi:hypothetical protein
MPFCSPLGENRHNTQAQECATAIVRGMEWVALDPRFSEVAGVHWLLRRWQKWATPT